MKWGDPVPPDPNSEILKCGLYLIDASIGYGDAQNDFKTISGMAKELDYTQEQFDAMLMEVAESYGKDQGKGLIEAAFGKV